MNHQSYIQAENTNFLNLNKKILEKTNKFPSSNTKDIASYGHTDFENHQTQNSTYY